MDTNILLESGTNELEILEFTLGDNHYGINVAKIREILSYQKVTPVPNTHPSVEGIFMPREVMITVINLKKCLGMEDDGQEGLFIITNFNKLDVAFHVDQVVGIHRVSWNEIIKPDSTINGEGGSVATGVIKMDGKLVVILDFEAIVSSISPETGLRVNDIEQIGERSRSEDTILIAEDSPLLSSLITDCLKKAGLKEFQLSVGHAEFFRGLTDAAGLKEEQEEELHDLISNKNYFGVTEFAETLSLNDNLKALFGMLGNLYTGSDELQTAKKYASEYPRILAAIERLEELHQVLKIYGIDKYVSVELGIVSNYQYYTGIIFAGYTFGSGEPIVKGGRYDELLTYFGKESASIGFAIVIDQLMAALSRQKIEIPVQYQNELIIYDSKMRSEAIKKAMELRTDGRNVELMARDISKTEEDYRTYAKQNHFVNVTFM